MCPDFRVGSLDTAEKRCRSSSTASLCPRRNLSVCAQETVHLAVSQAHLAGHQIPPSLDRLRSLRAIFTARGHGKAQVQRVSGRVTIALPHLLVFCFFASDGVRETLTNVIWDVHRSGCAMMCSWALLSDGKRHLQGQLRLGHGPHFNCGTVVVWSLWLIFSLDVKTHVTASDDM